MIVTSLDSSSPLACMKGWKAQACTSLPPLCAVAMDAEKRFAAYSSFLLGIRILSTLDGMANKLKIYVKPDGGPEDKVYDTMEWCDHEWLGRMRQEARLYKTV